MISAVDEKQLPAILKQFLSLMVKLQVLQRRLGVVPFTLAITASGLTLDNERPALKIKIAYRVFAGLLSSNKRQ